MNSKNIAQILELGGEFANLTPRSRPYIAPLWETIAQMVELIAAKDGECEAHDIAAGLGLSINTARHYVTALVKSGFPIERERLACTGTPMVYRVDKQKIKFLRTKQNRRSE